MGIIQINYNYGNKMSNECNIIDAKFVSTKVGQKIDIAQQAKPHVILAIKRIIIRLPFCYTKMPEYKQNQFVYTLALKLLLYYCEM
ncbi:hypothetical protein A0256_19795 [Mucilaginibacter sp. PAMC 26640]|nr:hypothetical protein A0256_19795 [Mucilaginibacter sp. PAMC 26640]